MQTLSRSRENVNQTQDRRLRMQTLSRSRENVNQTQDRRLRMQRLVRSRQRRSRPVRNMRVLYTQKESLDMEDNDGIAPESPSKRTALSTISFTATVGDGSHIDSNFDDVNIIAGTSRTQTLPFQSSLNKSIFVPGKNLEVVPKPIQQHKTAHNLFNDSNMEVLPSTSGNCADGQNAVSMVDNSMFGRSESQSPSVSGITRLQVTKISAMSNKSGIPFHSVDGSSSVKTNRMCTMKAETAEQTASTHKPQQLNDEEGGIFATQPVSRLLLKGQYKQLYNLKLMSLS
jgi:hypothetical protein